VHIIVTIHRFNCSLLADLIFSYSQILTPNVRHSITETQHSHPLSVPLYFFPFSRPSSLDFSFPFNFSYKIANHACMTPTYNRHIFNEYDLAVTKPMRRCVEELLMFTGAVLHVIRSAAHLGGNVACCVVLGFGVRGLGSVLCRLYLRLLNVL
jgi:hypothetical protein